MSGKYGAGSNIFRSFAATKLRTAKHLLIIKHLRKSEAEIVHDGAKNRILCG